MSNNWNIPGWLENNIRNRDKDCIYCHKLFKDNSKDKATWEHIDNDETNISEENIALCCASCNASKGTKKLAYWFNSEYCKTKNISLSTISVK